MHGHKDLSHEKNELIINREAREIIRLVASVRPSVRPSVCAAEWSIYGLGLLSAKENHMTHGIQSKITVCLSVFKKRFVIKSCAQRSGAFNLLWAVSKSQLLYQHLVIFSVILSVLVL